MYLKPLIVATALVFAASAFAQTRSPSSSPGASGFTPGHEMQEKGPKPGSPGASGYAPGHEKRLKGARNGPGASGYAPGHEMKHRNTAMPERQLPRR